MKLSIQEISPRQFPLYDAIPIRFEVSTVLQVAVIDGGLGGFRLVEHALAEPYLKDYDAHHDDNPSAWSLEFDLSRWGILLARDGERPVGGAAVALDAQVYPLDRFQRDDLAVLFDIRVHPDYQRRGIGRRLFAAAANWARERGYSQLGLETQTVNVPACHFYAQLGCQLGAIHRFGYAGVPEVAHEAMLLWYFDLG